MGKVVNINTSEYDVLIDRTTKWGNPYSHRVGTNAKYVVSSRKEAIQKYKEYLLSNKSLMSEIHSLKGKILGCHCKPKSCHGDVILEILNKRSLI